MGEWIELCDGVDVLVEDGRPVRLAIREDDGDTDEYRALRDRLDARFGAWFDLALDRSEAGEAGETVIPVRLSDLQPTHRLEIRTPANAPARVEYVHLHEEGAAYSHVEWDCEDHAAWTYDSKDGWLCEGQATPGGANGTVEVFTLDG